MSSYTVAEHVRCWVTFLVVSIAAKYIAPHVSKIGLPTISGYLIVGASCGPYLLGIVEKADIHSLKYINLLALAYITTSAGAELNIDDLKPIWKKIAAQVAGFNFMVYLTITLSTKALASTSLSKFTNDMTENQQWAVALIMGAMMITGSPAAAVALVRELKCKGKFTSTFLGLTMTGDLGVLVMIPLCLSYANVQFNGGTFQPKTAGIVLATMTASILLGAVVASAYAIVMKFSRFIVNSLVFPIGFLVFFGCQEVAAEFKRKITDSTVKVQFEPLLMCIVAGFLVANFSKYRYRFIAALNFGGPYIFLPFFTLVGASLDLPTFVRSVPFAVVIAVLRMCAFFIGAGTGGYLAGQERHMNLTTWMTQISQAGFSFGLAAGIAQQFPGWGESLQAVAISCIVVNLLIGPVLTKRAVLWSGEAGKGSGMEALVETENDPFDIHVSDRNKAVVVGVTPRSKALVLSLLKMRWGVTVLTKSVAESLELGQEVADWAEELRREAGGGDAEQPEEQGPAMRFEDNFRAVPVTFPQNNRSHPFEAGAESVLKDLVPELGDGSESLPGWNFTNAEASFPSEEAPGPERYAEKKADTPPERSPIVVSEQPVLTSTSSFDLLCPEELEDDDVQETRVAMRPLATQSFAEKCVGVLDVLDNTEALKTVVLALESDLASLALLETMQSRWGDKAASAIRVLVCVKDLVWAEPIAMLNGVPLHDFVSSHAASLLAAVTPLDSDAVLVRGATNQSEWSDHYLNLYDGGVLFRCSEQGKTLRDLESLELPSEAVVQVLSVVNSKMKERGSRGAFLTGGRMAEWTESIVQRVLQRPGPPPSPTWREQPRLLQVDIAIPNLSLLDEEQKSPKREHEMDAQGRLEPDNPPPLPSPHKRRLSAASGRRLSATCGRRVSNAGSIAMV